MLPRFRYAAITARLITLRRACILSLRRHLLPLRDIARSRPPPHVRHYRHAEPRPLRRCIIFALAMPSHPCLSSTLSLLIFITLRTRLRHYAVYAVILRLIFTLRHYAFITPHTPHFIRFIRLFTYATSAIRYITAATSFRVAAVTHTPLRHYRQYLRQSITLLYYAIFAITLGFAI